MAWLGMYDFGALQQANDVLWAALRSCLLANGADARHLPATLSRDLDLIDAWTDPHLVLAQTCGYPYAKVLKEKGAKIVATPIYDAPLCECPGWSYRSLVIVKADSPHHSLESLRGTRAAINSIDSNSGMNALRHLIAPLTKNESGDSGQAAFFSAVVVSGGHLRSVEMVAEGSVDTAAIDCVTLSLLADQRPYLTVRVIAKTTHSPGLPLITSSMISASDLARLRSCLTEVFESEDETDINVLEWALPGAPGETSRSGGADDDQHRRRQLVQAKKTLRIKGIKVWQSEDEANEAYQRILDIEEEANNLDYPELK